MPKSQLGGILYIFPPGNLANLLKLFIEIVLFIRKLFLIIDVLFLLLVDCYRNLVFP